jgi:hypothetical protein
MRKQEKARAGKNRIAISRVTERTEKNRLLRNQTQQQCSGSLRFSTDSGPRIRILTSRIRDPDPTRPTVVVY